MSMRNKKTGIVHGHGMTVGRPPRWTACGRYELWNDNTEIDTDKWEWVYEFDAEMLCGWCKHAFKNKIAWLIDIMEGKG